VVHPENNPNAWFIFQRDVRRICQYFAGQGVESDPRGLAEGMWLRYGHEPVDPLLPEDDLEEREEDNDFGDEMEE
jgi:serine/threonine-protein kinase RIO1